MNIEVNLNNFDKDIKKFQKMILIYNALEDGWNVEKKDNNYVFQKKHENNLKYFDDKCITGFLKKYLKSE